MRSSPRRSCAARALQAVGLLAALALLIVAAACGGGGGGGGGPTQPPPPQTGIVFTPASGGGAAGITLASGAATGGASLFLEVHANSVHDLYALAFDLQFPAAVLRFVRVTPGPLLASGTAEASVGTAGDLVAGLTQLGAVPGVNGSGVLATFEFQAIASGSGALTFSRNTALDSGGAPISGLSWSAGTVQVTL
ncbi:MAG TPA: cohesin domain-containing protein [Thermoanaerobaculia bacterium]|nr:cohesin domain-containing protein [Thermoanaerobaculia bacterium]